MSAEAKFHRARRMFCITEGVVRLAPARDRRSHMEWMIAEKFLASWDDRRFEDITRGYVLDGTLVAYRGLDFSAGSSVFRDVIEHLDGLVAAFGLAEDSKVYLGAKKARVGDVWVGREMCGEVGWLRDIR